MTHRRVQPGFTIFELILVLVIIGTMLAIVAPSFRGMRARTRVDDTAGQLLSMVNLARARAAMDGRPHQLVIDPVRHECWIEAQHGGGFVRPAMSYAQKVELDKQLTINATSPGSFTSIGGSTQVITLRVEPDGRSENLRLLVSDGEGNQRMVYAPSAAEPFRVGEPADADRYAIGGPDGSY